MPHNPVPHIIEPLPSVISFIIISLVCLNLSARHGPVSTMLECKHPEMVCYLRHRANRRPTNTAWQVLR